MDALHGTLSGTTTRKLCERALTVHGDARFERLAGISNGHLYNLRGHKTYQSVRGAFDKTRPTRINIGERRKPFPDGCPGYLRVDSVHQGDLDGIKGLYLINAVDEVTQVQVVCAVERISELFLLPVLEAMMDAFPFVIAGFHSDNGSEYINRRATLLGSRDRTDQVTLPADQRQRAGEQNASPCATSGLAIFRDDSPRWWCIHDRHTVAYLNFLRPCHFPTEFIDKKGKRRKRYRYEDMMTPYEKLKLLSEAADDLKPSMSFSHLDAIASEYSDNEAITASTRPGHNCFNGLIPTIRHLTLIIRKSRSGSCQWKYWSSSNLP